MAESLRIQLGKDQVERHRQTSTYTSPFQMRMNAMAQAKKNGTYKKPKYVPWRNPIVIASDRGIVSTPEQLKEIAGLPEVPAVYTVVDLTAEDCISEHPELSSDLPEVKLCEISDEAEQYLTEKVIVEERLVMFQGVKRDAWLLLSLKGEHDGDELMRCNAPELVQSLKDHTHRIYQDHERSSTNS